MIQQWLSAIRPGCSRVRADGFLPAFAVIGVFAAAIARGAYLLPDGFDGRGGINASLLLLGAIWAIARTARWRQPGSSLATAVEAVCLFLALSLLAALAAAAAAVGSGAYVDPWLDRIDTVLFPFFDWKAAALALPRYPALYEAFNQIYGTLNWQPFLFMVLCFVLRRTRDQIAFINAWAVGLALCILPFHWLPSVSAYGFHGIARADMPGSKFGLPWNLVPILEGLRDGTTRAIDFASLSGLVTMPSFHACAATILGWAFWRYRILRWPFALLNAAMALVAVPIGGHYVIDIVAGSAAGAVAIVVASRLGRRKPDGLPAGPEALASPRPLPWRSRSAALGPVAGV